MSCRGLIKCRGSGLGPLKSTFNAENFVPYAGCFGLSRAISVQFIHEMCAAAWNHEKFTKTPYFETSRSFKVIDIDTPKKLVASACYDKQHICAYLQPFSR